MVVEYGRYWRDGSIQADSSVSSRIKKWSITPLNKSALLCFVLRELSRDLTKMSFLLSEVCRRGQSSISNRYFLAPLRLPCYCFIAAYFKGRCALYFLKLLFFLFLIALIAMKCIRTRYDLPHPVLSVSQSVSAAKCPSFSRRMPSPLTSTGPRFERHGASALRNYLSRSSISSSSLVFLGSLCVPKASRT